jgi:hypothetical protein
MLTKSFLVVFPVERLRCVELMCVDSKVQGLDWYKMIKIWDCFTSSGLEINVCE